MSIVSAAPLDFVVPETAQYGPPVKSFELMPDVWSTVRSSAANSSFGSGDTIRFNISSASKFLRPSKCYLTARVTLDQGFASGTTAGPLTSYYGWPAGVISRVATSFNGTLVEDVNNYGLMCSGVYAKQTAEAKTVLKKLEHVGDQAALGLATSTSGGYFVHNLRTGVWETNQMIPLPIVKQVQLEITLAPISQLVSKASATGTQPTKFTLSDVSLHLCLATVDDAYLAQWGQSIRDGRVASIPVKLTRNIQNSLPASTYLNMLLSLGSVGSLTNVTAFIRDATYLSKAISTKTSELDELRCNDITKLSSWYITDAAGGRYPLDADIGADTNIDPTGTLVKVQTLAQVLASIDMSYASIGILDDADTNWYAKDAALHYSWEPYVGTFGNGLVLSDGHLSWVLNLTSALTDQSRFDVFLSYDAIILIGESIVVQKSGF